jgi:predicted DCC family thiol-disulfide oxidoreductase YuxK/uncharacterized membrane protein YphA (DoxX/SURF4 family)
MALLKRWNAYWFRPAPLVNLAICRIVVVASQLFLLVFSGYDPGRFVQLSALPDTLYHPLPVLRLLILPFGWSYRPALEIIFVTHWITVAAGVLALIGLWTNLALLVFAVGNVFMQAYFYSFGDYHHPEALMMITLSILALSPIGRVLSIDDLRLRLRLNVNRRRYEVPNILDEASVFARWPLLLIGWIYALVYLSAAATKLRVAGFDWMNGYTLQYYLLEDGLRWGSDMGVWLGQHHTLVLMLSWITILFEGTFFWVLISPRLAGLYVPMGVALHAGIYVAMRAPFFAFMVIYTVLVPWVPIFKTLSHLLPSPQKPELLFDGHCPLCIRSVTALSYFNWFGRLAFADLGTRWPGWTESHPEISLEDCQREMHVFLPDGSVRRGFFALRAALWYLPPLWPLLAAFYVPLASAIGPKLYRLVASRRARLDKCSFETCSMHSPDDRFSSRDAR